MFTLTKCQVVYNNTKPYHGMLHEHTMHSSLLNREVNYFDLTQAYMRSFSNLDRAREGSHIYKEALQLNCIKKELKLFHKDFKQSMEARGIILMNSIKS